MTSLMTVLRVLPVLAIAALIGAPAVAFGPAGHRIAGELAEPLLCARTAEEIRKLAEGESLAEIGLWADRVRNDPEWQHTASWHYMNIDDDTSIESYEHPRSGDVLWAIQHHAAELAEPGTGSRRGEALRFLVHFVVDVHQPLHVGRADDRGGNDVSVRLGGETLNLHRFWDTEVLRVDGLSEAQTTAQVASLVRIFAGRDHTSPRDWAEESLDLRPLVYGFRGRGREVGLLDDGYVDAANIVTRVRLAQAAVRLAATLNGLLGDAGCKPERRGR